MLNRGAKTETCPVCRFHSSSRILLVARTCRPLLGIGQNICRLGPRFNLIIFRILCTNTKICNLKSALAQTCVHPIETTMVKQQLTKKGKRIRPFPIVMVELAKAEGLGGWYRGITASILRELIYSSMRFGLYEPIRDQYQNVVNEESAPQRLVARMAAGCTAGGIAAFVACPTEVLKVRAQFRFSNIYNKI